MFEKKYTTFCMLALHKSYPCCFQEITGLDDTAYYVEWPHVASRTMTLLSSVTNPILYLAFSEIFQDIVRNWFRCFKKVEAQVTFGQTSQSRSFNTNKVAPADSTISNVLNVHSLENIE